MGKDTLKKIVPATYSKVESANNKLSKEISNLKKEIDTLKSANSSLQKKLSSMEKKNNNLFEEEKRLQEHLYEQLQKQIQSTSQDERNTLAQIRTSVDQMKQVYLYDNEYERKAIKSFYEYYERSDFKDLFLRLVRGLDAEDVAMIVKILQRQRRAKETTGAADLFSLEEQKEILKMKKELAGEILKVSDDMYCYKNYFLPIRHFEASVFYYRHGIDCIEHPEKIRQKDILDIGGFIGDSVLVLEPLTEKRIFTFEAVQKHYDLIKKTVELNSLDNVVIERMAMGDHEGEIEIEVAGSSSSINPNEVVKVTGAETVPLGTLDKYVETHPMEVGLIKVDIEGAEQSFLRGARKTIERDKPVLLMSIYHNADDFFNIKPMLESWDLGYKFRIHKPVDYSVSREVLLIAEVR